MAKTIGELRGEVVDAVKTAAHDNPVATICAVRALGLAFVIMFLTPTSFSYVIGPHGGRDVIVIWEDDSLVFRRVYDAALGFIPTWTHTNSETSTFPPPATSDRAYAPPISLNPSEERGNAREYK